MSEKILLFEVSSAVSSKVQKIASQMRIKTKVADKAEYGKTIGMIAETDDAVSSAGTAFSPDKSLMVMCGLTEKHMDRLLFALRRDNVDIGYKAILTKTNASWSVSRMYARMELEHKLTH